MTVNQCSPEPLLDQEQDMLSDDLAGTIQSIVAEIEIWRTAPANQQYLEALTSANPRVSAAADALMETLTHSVAWCVSDGLEEFGLEPSDDISIVDMSRAIIAIIICDGATATPSPSTGSGGERTPLGHAIVAYIEQNTVAGPR